MGFEGFETLSNSKLNEIKINAEKRFNDIKAEIDKLCTELIEIEDYYLKAEEEIKKRQNVKKDE